MTSSDARERARRLLLHEAAGTHDPRGLATAAERVCDRLREELTGLIGAGGVEALIGRALAQAQRDFPQLNGVEARPDTCFTGLPEALNGTSAEEAEAATTAVIERFLDLLVSLVGEDLGLRPVRKLWPGIALDEAGPGSIGRNE